MKRRFIHLLAQISGDQCKGHIELLKSAGEGGDKAITQLHVEKGELRASTPDKVYPIAGGSYRLEHLTTEGLDLPGNVQSNEEIILGDQHAEAAEAGLFVA